ncbi:helix-turn-helix domain-containing protein [Thermodesulfobacteriota bacterium]
MADNHDHFKGLSLDCYWYYYSDGHQTGKQRRADHPPAPVPTIQDGQEWISLPQAARLMGCHRDTALKWIKGERSRIPYRKDRRRWRIVLASLRAFLDRRNLQRRPSSPERRSRFNI